MNSVWNASSLSLLSVCCDTSYILVFLFLFLFFFVPVFVFIFVYLLATRFFFSDRPSVCLSVWQFVSLSVFRSFFLSCSSSCSSTCSCSSSSSSSSFSFSSPPARPPFNLRHRRCPRSPLQR